MEMPTIVAFVWGGERAYTLQHALVVQEQIRRWHPGIRFVAISDQEPIDGLEVMPMPAGAQALAHLKTPEGERFPSSYRRLWLFSDEARCLGERILLTDIDIVVTREWSPFWEYSEADFVGWRPAEAWGRCANRIAGGMWLLRTGSRTEVYERFVADPARAIAEARAADYRGSDQAWLSYCLSGSAVVWPRDIGWVSYRQIRREAANGRTVMPAPNGRVVHFNGRDKPWHASVQARHPWIREYWGEPTSPGYADEGAGRARQPGARPRTVTVREDVLRWRRRRALQQQ